MTPRLPLALIVVAAALVVAGLAMGSTGVEFGALALLLAAAALAAPTQPGAFRRRSTQVTP